MTFIVAAVTDWFDGYLARSLGQTSAFGAFLDPVADKLMVAAALIVLVHPGGWIPRDRAGDHRPRDHHLGPARMDGQGGCLRQRRGGLRGQAQDGTAQMSAIPLLLYRGARSGVRQPKLGTLLIYVAAVLTLWSMGYYMRWPGPSCAQAQPINQISCLTSRSLAVYNGGSFSGSSSVGRAQPCQG